MDIKITRMNGLGNRFAIADMRGDAPINRADMSALARRFGGCDQALFLLPPQNERRANSLFMEIFNGDGSRAQACGNGTRCVAWAEMNRLNLTEIIIETSGGVLTCRMADGAGDMIEVDMGRPRFDWAEIPLREKMQTIMIPFPETPALGEATAVNIGNPHIVFFPQDAARHDINKIGPALERHALFPEGVNISLAESKAPDHLKINVWERGAGATKACGTAACAALVAARRREDIDISRSAKIELPGGILDIVWRKDDDHVLMTGPVAWDGEEMFDGAH